MKRYVASIAILVTLAAIVVELYLLLIPVVVFVFFALMYFTHRILYDKEFKA